MAQVTGTPNDDTIGVGAASVGVEPATGATSENDTITGLAGADTLAGGAGNDTFQFDPSNPLEGNDVIQDFTAQAVIDPSQLDYVAFQSAQVLAADPDLPGADGDETSLSLDDFDASPNWNLSGSAGESLLIEHPGGSIEFAGIPSNAATSFNDLAPFIKVDGEIWSGPIDLTPEEEGTQVTGTPNDDTIGVGAASVGVEPATGATSENDTITGLAGADTLAGGAGNDTFQFDPSNPMEGNDVIQDFTAQAVIDPSQLDYVAFQSAQVLAADPDLPGADGDETSLSLDDFDASPNWNLSGSAGESLLIEHPGGSIEFAGIPSNAATSFNDLAPFIKVDGEIWSGPIDLTPEIPQEEGTAVTEPTTEPIVDVSSDIPDLTDMPDGAVDMLIT